ncbi:MAG: Lrp/AsnC family transcriptional regulator [Halieaceae bacterium]|jgi:Lrp/AsnC family transcriptional regulator|nr:Lrp/AsnC family transcriptional regulator [Halieaceae bacterium]
MKAISSSHLARQDIDILKLLQADSTMSTASIAERINVSQSPCWRRINRLEQEGVIRGRVALLDRSALGMDIVVFATINLTSTGRQNLMEFERDIVCHPEVMECYTMTGIWDYMLKIVTRDIRHYEAFVRNTLTASPSIRELHSHMAVTEIKNSTALPLDTQL